MPVSSEHNKRLEKLHSLYLLDSPTDPAFDRLTRLVSNILKTPISLVSLVDGNRQFFKSFVGLPEPWATTRETPLSHSFCQHVVTTGKPLIITDARTEPLVQDNLAIEELGVIAYAGMPMITSDGYILGSFCAIDTQPKQWTDEELNILSDLTDSVMTEIELQDELRERKQIQADLAKSEERYRILSELMSDYAFSALVSETGIIEPDWITEEAFERLSGFTFDEILALPHSTLMLEDDIEEVKEDIQATLAGETRQGHYRFKTKQGELRWLQVRRYPRWNETHDKVVGFYGIAHDITEERLIQQKKQELIAEQERTRALSQFITDVSHDFRTPLSIIQTSTYLLKQTTDSKKHRRIDLISEQATRLDDLIENLILISRLNNTSQWEFKPLDINQVIGEMQSQVTSQATDKTIELTWQLGETVPLIYADTTYLLLAINHLIDNAIQFTPATKQIIIRTFAETEDVVFEVEDAGIGISETDLPRIFERFFRADSARAYTGSNGMGLAIAKLIIELHQGSVEVESIIDQGSRFRLRFPILTKA
jgi:PAS domain S-box-containing protein